MDTRKDRHPKENAPSPKKSPKKFIDALMKNSIREKIMELLEQNPGMNKHQIAQALEIHINTMDFHLKRLVNAEMVETKAGFHSNEIHCFTTDNVHLWDDRSTRILYGRGPPRQVAQFLLENPGAKVGQITGSLGMSQQTAWRHLKILEQNELVQKIRIEREVIYHAEPKLLDWAQRVGVGVPTSTAAPEPLPAPRLEKI